MVKIKQFTWIPYWDGEAMVISDFIGGFIYNSHRLDLYASQGRSMWGIRFGDGANDVHYKVRGELLDARHPYKDEWDVAHTLIAEDLLTYGG